MMLENKNTFFSFSGYTKGLFKIIDIYPGETGMKFDIVLTQDMYEKIQKKQSSLSKKDNFTWPYCLELDGVPAKILEINTVGDNKYIVKSEVLKKYYEASTLKSLTKSSEVSLGLQSFNHKKYLVGQYTGEVSAIFPIGKAKLIHSKIATGHDYTQELTFEIPSDCASLVQKKKCIGLNGSAFYIKDLECVDGKLLLKVHVGRQTCEKTLIGTDKLNIGQEVNLSRAFAEEEVVYGGNSFRGGQT